MDAYIHSLVDSVTIKSCTAQPRLGVLNARRMGLCIVPCSSAAPIPESRPRIAGWLLIYLTAWTNPQVQQIGQSAPLAIDVLAECFYNKDGVWYYAGTYETLQMDELSVKEWAQLPANVCPFEERFRVALTDPSDRFCHC